MIGIWCTDGPIYIDENGNYYGITINNSIINRYLEYADKIYILTRIRKIEPEIKNATKIIVKNIEIIELPDCSRINNSIKNIARAKKIIKKYLDLSNFAIIGLPSVIGNVATTVCKKNKKIYIVELLACPWDALWNHGKILGKLMAPIQYIITKIKVWNAENVIYVSNQFLQKRYPNNKNCIGCSDVILEEYDNKVLDNRIKKINNYNLNYTYKIGLIGSLNLKYKGHKTAIDAIALLADKYKIELHFLGKGTQDFWKKYAENKNENICIKFDGTLPAGKPVYNWMDNMDIFLIPSLQEGLPRALVEAMSRACPAIGVKTGGIPELLTDEYVMKRKDYRKIAEKIEYLIKNKEEMIKQAKRNFYRVSEFQKEKIYKKRKNYYKKILEKMGENE